MRCILHIIVRCNAMLLCSAELHSSPRDAPLPGLGTALCILHITLLRVLHILRSNLRPDYCVFVIALLLHAMARLKRSNYYNITVLYGCVLRSCVQLQHLRSALLQAKLITLRIVWLVLPFLYYSIILL